MDHRIEVPDEFVIPSERFDNPSFIKARVGAAPADVQGCLKTALCFLYETQGPKNLPPDRKTVAWDFLEEREQIVAQWLSTRASGSERKKYGKNALHAARTAQYRCADCGLPDVRCLQLDHVEGRKDPISTFRCLCANCHQRKSRKKDWPTRTVVKAVEANNDGEGER
ncbi:HNH endonuclease [Myxococcus llanfairpwllgwyngyllgogerychwyrndrobwllllantysiliogogogochensis]|uniref:HNH endonuclease n=1 Tax=Myxococcus llanfairpwllgwyngyllgogerychwyrndrobwllllantysiliogogogochensis TaxID=2590453 RepID=A0A540WJI5_9BACT|nr:HNH endonuclease [Myxococcus llanfairpwllgwyngyllgogerychwyrndrobwllllantysiliogogogochensis]TQF09151.1 HNH endonuclease [Myxococcus llanfairpwllgwyngyllgogerychwyrndrobwllllantysiliogogogochensis]